MKKILKNKKVVLCLAFVIVLMKKVKNGFRQTFAKKSLVTAMAAVAVVIIGVGTTFSLLRVQTNGEVTNVFQSAKINVQVVEENETNESGESDQGNVMLYGTISNGETVVKKVQIQNVHSDKYPTTDTFVRCRIVPILRDQEANNIATKVSYTINGKHDLWREETVNGETYYYWTKVLPRGERTDYLFESVTLTSEIPDGAYLELQVLVDAVQARPYVELKDKEKAPVYEAWGWYYDTSDQTLKK